MQRACRGCNVLAAGRCADRSKAPSPRTVTEVAGSNAQCEQFDRADSDHEHCEGYGIVVKPIPLCLHGTPPCSRLISRPAGKLVQMHHKALEFLVNCNRTPTKAAAPACRPRGPSRVDMV